jgi:hypothetical protein
MKKYTLLFVCCFVPLIIVITACNMNFYDNPCDNQHPSSHYSDNNPHHHDHPKNPQHPHPDHPKNPPTCPVTEEPSDEGGACY